MSKCSNEQRRNRLDNSDTIESTQGLECAIRSVMRMRITLAVMLAIAVVITPLRLPAATCILSQAPSQQACKSGCCANMSCCITSHQNTSPVSQPLAKNGTYHDLAVAPTDFTVIERLPLDSQSSARGAISPCEHSPPALALIGIRLI